MSDPTGNTGGVVSDRYWTDTSDIVYNYWRNIRNIFDKYWMIFGTSEHVLDSLSIHLKLILTDSVSSLNV